MTSFDTTPPNMTLHNIKASKVKLCQVKENEGISSQFKWREIMSCHEVNSYQVK